MLHDLRDARRAQCGGKAAALGTLLRAGIDVPPGIVVPIQEYQRHLLRDGLDPGAASPEEMRGAIGRMRLADELVGALDSRLRERPGLPAHGGLTAVRSSATTEDGAAASAAGQHVSVLAVRGIGDVCAAVRRCWASLWSERAVAYRQDDAVGRAVPPQMAVIVQQFLAADVSGVLFTGVERVLEAVPGRGDRLVGGEVSPDSWRIDEGGIRAVRAGGTGDCAPGDRVCLSDAQVLELDALGEQISRILGAPADIEWALVGDRFHVLQARPITVPVPGPSAPASSRQGADVRQGIPASGGTATGTARIVRGPQDFRRVEPGDVLICRSTDPAWTPLFRIAGAVVTEVGGVLSHAAIVARELGIPAVLAVPGAVAGIADGSVVTVHGDEGIVSAAAAPGTGP